MAPTSATPPRLFDAPEPFSEDELKDYQGGAGRLLVLPHSRLRTKLRGPGVSLRRWAVQALVAQPAAKDVGANSRRGWPAARAPALLALADHGASPSPQEHRAGARVSLL